MIGLSLLSSVSKHTMWSYYDCIYFCFRSSVNTICGRIMIGFIVVFEYDHILCLLKDDNNNKPNHNTTTYCVY
jgi:hypothetical protein